jgi:hypothetical protein
MELDVLQQILGEFFTSNVQCRERFIEWAEEQGYETNDMGLF